MNTALDEYQFAEENRWEAARVLEVFDTVFDVLKPTTSGRPGDLLHPKPPSLPDAEVEGYIEERERARKARDFARADEIRGLLQENGILIEDARDGVRWKRK